MSAPLASLLSQNDALIRSPDLSNGFQIVRQRARVYLDRIAGWAEGQRFRFGYDKPFAVGAVGGTGRLEMTPNSDLDIVLLFPGKVRRDLANNAFYRELRRQTVDTRQFELAHGFSLTPIVCGLDDAGSMQGKDLNAFLDLHPVYDPEGLTGQLRERIRETCDLFAHFLYLHRKWEGVLRRGAERVEFLDRFNIKAEGLRLFLNGAWTLASRDFRHSSEIFPDLEDKTVLAAHGLLLRIRCWQHLRRGAPSPPDHGGNHAEDVMTFDDFLALDELAGEDADETERFEFAARARELLLRARRQVATFGRAVMEHELRIGRPVKGGSPVRFGRAGMFRVEPAGGGPLERSEAAFDLLLNAQRNGVRVDPDELQGAFHQAGCWLARCPAFGRLLMEETGSLARTFDFMAQIDGAMERLFPGYSKFEASLDERVVAGRGSLQPSPVNRHVLEREDAELQAPVRREVGGTRAVIEREKLRYLESMIAAGQSLSLDALRGPFNVNASDIEPAVVAAGLDNTQLAAVRLAIKTKRLPVTAGDLEARADPALCLMKRVSSGLSGIPLDQYFEGWENECGLPPETLDLTRFLVAQRRAFKDAAKFGSNPDEMVREFAGLCGDAGRLRALYVFTHADSLRMAGDAPEIERWFHTRELFWKALRWFEGGDADAASALLEPQGMDEERLRVLRDFGEDFFSGIYAPQILKFGTHLFKLATGGETKPKTRLYWEGPSPVLAVAARDWRGLAACISGEFFSRGISVRQAHLFSAMMHGLALDFFHIDSAGGRLPKDLEWTVERAILERRHLDREDAGRVPPLEGRIELTEREPGTCVLRFECLRDQPGLVYGLTLRACMDLEADVFSLLSEPAGAGARISLVIRLPAHLSLDQARGIVAGWAAV
jgi:hypothetical protein